MSDSLQKIDHNFPENIDTAIDNFKKTIVKKKKPLIETNIFHNIQEEIESQIKETLAIWKESFLWIKYNKKLKNYNHKKIIASFKEQLKNVPNIEKNDNENININLFMILNNLALYLSSSWNFIRRQDYEEMWEIIKSKWTSFRIEVLEPELSCNIDKNTCSTADRWKKKFPIKINLPSIKKINYNDENTPTLTKLSEALIQKWNQTLLWTIEEIPSSKQQDLKSTREEIIKNESKKFKWYFSIWGKIHFKESIPKEKVDEFEKEFWFQSTGFKLIHANKSLLLPPSCSPNILLFYILALEKFGLIDWEPDLQLSIPWRLPNRAAWVLWSATLLSWDTHTEYSPEAFSTNQDDLTWARIMAYDAWILNNKFKHNSPKLKWRTDMLGIVDLNKVYTYHFLGSLLSQIFYGWKYSKIGKEFIKEYINLLEKYSLKQILQEERIYNKDTDNPKSGEQHYTLIKTITDIQKNNREQFLQTNSQDWLIVFDIKNLLNKYKKKLKYKKDANSAMAG